MKFFNKIEVTKKNNGTKKYFKEQDITYNKDNIHYTIYIDQSSRGSTKYNGQYNGLTAISQPISI